MQILKRAFMYLLPLLRVTMLAALCLVAALALIRGAVWGLSSATIAPGVRGPEIHVWSEQDTWFGGLSALIMAPDGTRLLSASDRGRFVEANVTRDGTGRIIAITDTRLTRISLQSGLPPTNFKMDIEALTPLSDGRIAQAFEAFVRIETLDTPTARPAPTHPWDRFAARFSNEAFEALATLPDGRLLAITELPDKATGDAVSMLYDGTRWRRGPAVPLSGRFRITGADVGPDGCLYLVERRFGVLTGFTFRLRRLSGGVDGWRDDLLYTAPMATLGNAEGISAWQGPDRTIVLSVVNDNNYLPLQRTRLMEFRTDPGTCTLAL